MLWHSDKIKSKTYLDYNAAAANNFSGFAFFVQLAKANPLTQLLVALDLQRHKE